MSLRLIVNGQPVDLDVPGMRRLLDVLREDLGLTGTKEGCGEGECGACTVLLDGAPVDSCLVPISQCGGTVVETVEGLGADGQLGVLQQAFLETGGAQCGICTPGMLMAGAAYLASDAVRAAGGPRQSGSSDIAGPGAPEESDGPDRAESTDPPPSDFDGAVSLEMSDRPGGQGLTDVAPSDIAGVGGTESSDGRERETIREAIAGNLCRCTGYTKIIDAIALAAARGRAGG